ncbi:MAG: hypothetical protein AAF846_24080 [Chloroflexota bacterium]
MMQNKWQFIILWSVGLFGASIGLPIFSQVMSATVGLPFILSDMVVAFGVGTLLGGAQAQLYSQSSHWRSHTAWASVGGALLVGGATIFAQAASAFPIDAPVSLAYALIPVGIVQAMTLPDSFKYRSLWVLSFVLMTIATALQLWLGVVVMAVLLATMMASVVKPKQKQKRHDVRDAIDRLSDERHGQNDYQHVSQQRLVQKAKLS